MKSSYLRAGVLASAFALSACGGSGQDVLVGGPIYGLTKDSLVLQINGGSDLTLKANSASFYFQFKSDSPFEITVKSSPSNAVCTVARGKGTTSTFNLNNIVVDCVPNTHKLSATVIGLGAATDLLLINGADQQPVKPVIQTGPDGSPVYPPVVVQFAPVAEDAFYGVQVRTQPTGKSCSVANGAGKMGITDITDVQVTCN
jgi:hypothetical protein